MRDPHTRRGRFITIEGTDGAGKSTQIAHLQQFLKTRGIDVLITREPGGTAMGEAIRDLLLVRNELQATPATQLLLVFAARSQHLSEVIRPALDRGEFVICDRFTDATYAYQGGAGGLGFESVEAIERWVQGDLRPDLTLLFDLPVDVGLSRARGRGEDADRFEGMNLDARERIRAAYLELARRHPERIEVIDASPGRERVTDAMLAVLARRLQRWGEA